MKIVSRRVPGRALLRVALLTQRLHLRRQPGTQLLLRRLHPCDGPDAETVVHRHMYLSYLQSIAVLCAFPAGRLGRGIWADPPALEFRVWLNALLKSMHDSWAIDTMPPCQPQKLPSPATFRRSAGGCDGGPAPCCLLSSAGAASPPAAPSAAAASLVLSAAFAAACCRCRSSDVTAFSGSILARLFCASHQQVASGRHLLCS